jgi:arylsulfatase A-like enzyme
MSTIAVKSSACRVVFSFAVKAMTAVAGVAGMGPIAAQGTRGVSAQEAVPVRPVVQAARTSEVVARKPKNIVFILCDDVGYGDLSSYGSVLTPTPNVDRLAQGGLRFTDANAAAPVCTASRYAVLTGQYSWRRGVPNIAPGDSKLLIPTTMPTLPGMLRSAGYSTFVIGKWHLGFGESTPDWNKPLRPGPLEVGFDSYFGFPSTNDRVPPVYIEDDRVVGLDPADPIQVRFGNPTTWPAGMTDMIDGFKRIGGMTGGKAAIFKNRDLADVLTKRVCDTIEKNQDKPFFIFFAPHSIHTPLLPHPRFKGTGKTGVRGEMINEMDWSVGQVLDTLDRLKLADDTMVIFSSDNGGVRSARAPEDGHKFNGNLRGVKSNVWEGGHRVPLIVRWPGRIAPGTVSSQVFSLVDCYATLSTIVGESLAADAAPDSLDQSRIWLDPSITTPVREVLLTGNTDRDVAIRFEGWKYIPIGGAGGYMGGSVPAGSPSEQLYHLAMDPSETHNLVTTETGRVESLKRMRRLLIDQGSSRPGFGAGYGANPVPAR